jgi:predicted ATPase
VELAPLSDPDLVAGALARSLGMRDQPNFSPSEAIVRYLYPREMLLVLDNCEHLVNACARLAEELLRACPNLRVMATSREALRIAGESAWQVRPLSLPDPDLAATAERLGSYESVRLFVERTKAVVADFELNDRNAPSSRRVPPARRRTTRHRTRRGANWGALAGAELEESGKAETLRRGHAHFFLQFAEGSEPGLNGPERRLFLGRLEAEHDNLRAALGEITGGDAGLRLAGALWWFWFHRGYRDEGLGWLGATLGRSEPASAPARAKALCGAGWLSFVQGDHEAGRSDLEKGVTVAREAGDDVGLAYALGLLAVLRAHQGDPAPALAEEGVRLFRTTGERWGSGSP